jgi:glycoprotein endo-alpha-1,2-mannosidase
MMIARMRLVLVLIAMALAVQAVVTAGSAAPASGGDTSIFYYPWWGTPKRDGSFLHWNQDGHVPPVGDLASSFYPARGPYSSSNWKLLRAQMKDIAGAGVREVVSSWWGTGSFEDQRLPAVMRAAWKEHLDVAVQIEPYEKWQRTLEVLRTDLAHLQSLGIGRVYVYQPFDEFMDESAWQELTSAHPDIEFYGQTQDLERAVEAGFDGIYTYDVYSVRGGAFAGLCERAHAVGLACAPSVGPGYDASRATTDERIRRRRDGKTYDGMWRAAIAARPDRITITSYNEWHEGTQIEAARKGPETPYGAYASYEGAYGKKGKAAETAYLARTAYWTKAYHAAVAKRGTGAFAAQISP